MCKFIYLCKSLLKIIPQKRKISKEIKRNYIVYKEIAFSMQQKQLKRLLILLFQLSVLYVQLTDQIYHGRTLPMEILLYLNAALILTLLIHPFSTDLACAPCVLLALETCLALDIPPITMTLFCMVLQAENSSKLCLVQKDFITLYLAIRLTFQINNPSIISIIWIQTTLAMIYIVYLFITIKLVENSQPKNLIGSQREEHRTTPINFKKDISIDLNLMRPKAIEDSPVQNIYRLIIEQFPEGVAILKVSDSGKPLVSFCNDTMKSMLRLQANEQLTKKLDQLRNLCVIGHQKQGADEGSYNVGQFKYESFSEEQNDKNPGIVKRFMKAGSEQLIRVASQSRRFTNITTDSKRNAFKKELTALCINIQKQPVQEYLSRLRNIFEIYSILNGYIGDRDIERCLEIKLFMFYQNESPQVLLLVRDVSHRDVIKQLHRSDKAKSNQLSFVSHEYRTPLGCMIPMLEMCIDNDTSMSNQKMLQVILQNCRHLLSLSNDLVDLAQIKVGKFKLNKVQFNLQQLLENCIETFNVLSEQNDIKLELNYPPELPTVIYQDMNRVHQVVMNLIGNAFKFTLKGQITITIEQIQQFTLTIRINDTGIGIKEKDKQLLFKAFGRIDGDEHKYMNRQGVGLGLLISNLICKSLNDDHQGIHLESTFGQGTEFSFTIGILDDGWLQNPLKSTMLTIENQVQPPPVPREEPAQFLYSSVSSHHKINTQSKIGSIRTLCKCPQILIVDDNQFNIEVMQMLLALRKITNADSAMSGEQTIKMVNSKLLSPCCRQYQIIFLDLEMPDMSGLQTQRQLNTVFQQHKLRTTVIACSGYQMSQQRDKCMFSGMQDYLEKPISRKELDRVFARYYY